MKTVNEKTLAKCRRIADRVGAIVDVVYDGKGLEPKYTREGITIIGPTPNGFSIQFQIEYLENAFKAAAR